MKILTRIIWLIVGATVVLAQQARAESDLIGVAWSLTNSEVVAINPATGQAMTIGLSGVAGLNSLARNSAGMLFSVGGTPGDQLVTINPATGVGTVVATLDFGLDKPSVSALAFSANDTLYAINDGNILYSGDWSDNLYTIDVQTGVGTLIGTTAGFVGISSLDFSPQGLLYGWDVAANEEEFGGGLILINPTNGLVTASHPTIGYLEKQIESIVFAPDGTLYGAGRDGLYRIDVTTGATTLIGDAPADLRGIEVVPEPLPPLSIRLSEVEVCWPSTSNQFYRVQYRSELTTNMWTFLMDIQASNRTTCITDKIAVGQPQRFYRLVPPL